VSMRGLSQTARRASVGIWGARGCRCEDTGCSQDRQLSSRFRGWGSTLARRAGKLTSSKPRTTFCGRGRGSTVGVPLNLMEQKGGGGGGGNWVACIFQLREIQNGEKVKRNPASSMCQRMGRIEQFALKKTRGSLLDLGPPTVKKRNHVYKAKEYTPQPRHVLAGFGDEVGTAVGTEEKGQPRSPGPARGEREKTL